MQFMLQQTQDGPTAASQAHNSQIRLFHMKGNGRPMLQNGLQMLLILLITYYITRLLHGKNVPPIPLQLSLL